MYWESEQETTEDSPEAQIHTLEISRILGYRGVWYRECTDTGRISGMIPDSIVGTDVCLWKTGIHVRGSEGEVLRRGGKESDNNQAGSFIEADYWIRYTPRHIREMLRNREFQHAKPYDVDYRRLTEAEATLKRTRSIHGVSDQDVI